MWKPHHFYLWLQTNKQSKRTWYSLYVSSSDRDTWIQNKHTSYHKPKRIHSGIWMSQEYDVTTLLTCDVLDTDSIVSRYEKKTHFQVCEQLQYLKISVQAYWFGQIYYQLLMSPWCAFTQSCALHFLSGRLAKVYIPAPRVIDVWNGGKTEFNIPKPAPTETSTNKHVFPDVVKIRGILSSKRPIWKKSKESLRLCLPPQSKSANFNQPTSSLG